MLDSLPDNIPILSDAPNDFKAVFMQQAVKTTHQHIADELGTAREVVTRLLKDLEADRKIELKRGLIRILDKEKLQDNQ